MEGNRPRDDSIEIETEQVNDNQEEEMVVAEGQNTAVPGLTADHILTEGSLTDNNEQQGDGMTELQNEQQQQPQAQNSHESLSTTVKSSTYTPTSQIASSPKQSTSSNLGEISSI